MESQRIEIPKSASSPNDATTQPAPTLTSIENRLQAWVKSVEKDTQKQVQNYLEQIDAGQSGE